MLILYTYLDIYLKLSSKYDIGFMVWYDWFSLILILYRYLTLLISKIHDIEEKFMLSISFDVSHSTLSDQKEKSRDKKFHKKFATELSPFTPYINQLWLTNYAYLTSFLYVCIFILLEWL